MNELTRSKLSYYIEAYHNTFLEMTSSVERTKIEEELFRTLTRVEKHQEIATFIREFLQRVDIDKFYLEIIKKIYETFNLNLTNEIDYIKEQKPEIIERASEISEKRATFRIKNNPFIPFILALEEQESHTKLSQTSQKGNDTPSANAATFFTKGK